MTTNCEGRSSTTMVAAGVAVVIAVFAFVFGLEAIGSAKTVDLLKESGQLIVTIAGGLFIWSKTRDAAASSKETAGHVEALRNGELEAKIEAAVTRVLERRQQEREAAEAATPKA